jgi:hypothetical protein
MERIVEYVFRLGNADRYRHQHIRDKGRIVHFSVQLETLIENRSYPVVRYDTSHGFAHRDLISKNGEVAKTPIFIHDYNDALTFAESDLKVNWEMYKERFLRGD